MATGSLLKKVQRSSNRLCLYDESGEFSVHVGVPAKSGVGGGLMAAVPNRYGIGVFSPALDPFGNSAAGIQLLKDVVKELDADIFE